MIKSKKTKQDIVMHKKDSSGQNINYLTDSDNKENNENDEED